MSVVELLTQKEFIVALIIFSLMFAAIRWLLKDRERLLKLLSVAHKSERDLLIQRTDEATRAGNEYREFGESSREVMREWTGKNEGLASKIDMLIAIRSGA